MNCRRLVSLASCAAGLLGTLAPAPAAGAEKVVLRGEAEYQAPGCSGTTRTTKWHPLRGAEVFLRLRGNRPRLRIRPNGRFGGRLKLPAVVKGHIELDGRNHAFVGGRGKDPVRWKFLERVARPERGVAVLKLRLPDTDPEHNAASAFALLDRGTALASRTVPQEVDLGKLPVHFGTKTAYRPIPKDIVVNNATLAHQYEPWALNHEYAHWILERVANPAVPADAAHHIDRSYPNEPTTIWSEGFAHAFAAIVGGEPVLGTRCRRNVDLAQGTPLPSDGVDNLQYNEVHTGSIVWQLVSSLGSGDLRAGYARFLAALREFDNNYGRGPHDMREVRDSLIEAGVETTLEEHNEFSRAYRRVLGFGARVRFNVVPGPGGNCQGEGDELGMCETGLSVAYLGPGGFSCAETVTGLVYSPEGDGIGMTGGIPHAWQDDCIQGYNEVTVRYPYLAGQAHRAGDWTFDLTATCRSHPYTNPDTGETEGVCPQSFNVESTVDTSFEESTSVSGNTGARSTFTVASGQKIRVLRYSVDGAACELYPNVDCRKWSTFTQNLP